MKPRIPLRYNTILVFFGESNLLSYAWWCKVHWLCSRVDYGVRYYLKSDHAFRVANVDEELTLLQLICYECRMYPHLSWAFCLNLRKTVTIVKIKKTKNSQFSGLFRTFRENFAKKIFHAPSLVAHSLDHNRLLIV